MSSAANLVNLAYLRNMEKLPERMHQIEAVDVVADLLALVVNPGQ